LALEDEESSSGSSEGLRVRRSHIFPLPSLSPSLSNEIESVTDDDEGDEEEDLEEGSTREFFPRSSRK